MVIIVCCMYGIIRISFLRFTYAYIIYLFYAIVKPKRCGFHPTRKHVGFRRKFITYQNFQSVFLRFFVYNVLIKSLTIKKETVVFDRPERACYN